MKSVTADEGQLSSDDTLYVKRMGSQLPGGTASTSSWLLHGEGALSTLCRQIAWQTATLTRDDIVRKVGVSVEVIKTWMTRNVEKRPSYTKLTAETRQKPTGQKHVTAETEWTPFTKNCYIQAFS